MQKGGLPRKHPESGQRQAQRRQPMRVGQLREVQLHTGADA